MSSNKLSNIPISVLDLAPIIDGKTIAETFHNSLDLARNVEKLGYKRYWLAEHHNMESIASSATAVLIGYIAGGTSTIRVGSGGIMLPNHAPLVVAEQFGTLATLYPNRIDLGLGRAPGTDQLTAMALRRDRFAANDFPQNIQELATYFSAENKAGRVRAIPGEGVDVPIWILGSSTDSAYLAAYLGLPYAFASHFAPTYLLDAFSIYRQNFRPSNRLQEPYTMACVNVMAADTDEEANRLATSFYQLAIGIVRGKTRAMQPPVDTMKGIWNEFEEAAVKERMQYSFVGSAPTIKANIENFITQTNINELMAVSHIYEHTARVHSYEILAQLKNSSH